MKTHLLFSKDFRAFPIGEFPYDPDHTATGEYHYVVEKGDRGAWVDQVCNYNWRGHYDTTKLPAESIWSYGDHYVSEKEIAS